MKKIMSLLVVFCLLFSQFGHASISEVRDDNTLVGRPRAINFGAGLVATLSAGVVSVTAAATAITSGTIDGAVIGGITPAAITGTIVAATQYAQLPYYAPSSRPASGATRGSMISKGGANAQDCGTAAGTTFVVCVSDGSNWKAL